MPVRVSGGTASPLCPIPLSVVSFAGLHLQKIPKNPSLKNLHKLMGARAAKNDHWKMANVHTLYQSLERCWESTMVADGEHQKRKDAFVGKRRGHESGLVWYTAHAAQRSGCGQAIFSWSLSNLLLYVLLLWLMWTSLVLLITFMQLGPTGLQVRLETGTFRVGKRVIWNISDAKSSWSLLYR